MGWLTIRKGTTMAKKTDRLGDAIKACKKGHADMAATEYPPAKPIKDGIAACLAAIESIALYLKERE